MVIRMTFYVRNTYCMSQRWKILLSSSNTYDRYHNDRFQRVECPDIHKPYFTSTHFLKKCATQFMNTIYGYINGPYFISEHNNCASLALTLDFKISKKKSGLLSAKNCSGEKIYIYFCLEFQSIILKHFAECFGLLSNVHIKKTLPVKWFTLFNSEHIMVSSHLQKYKWIRSYKIIFLLRRESFFALYEVKMSNADRDFF